MGERIRCRICKVETEVNDYGRCRSCQTAYEATEIYHTTYGKLQGQKEQQKQMKSPTPLLPSWKICPHCGKRFYANHGKRIYCSNLCAQKVQQNRRQEKRHQQPIPSRICAICGKEFTPSRNSSRIKYCGRECYELSVMEHHRTNSRRKQDTNTGTVQSAPPVPV